MTRRSIYPVLALATLVTLSLVAAAQTLNGFDLKDALVPPDEILHGGPGRDGIPAIDSPKFVSARAANLAPADRVLGLARNGVVKAYAVKILNWHEIVNDRFGEEPIAVTYCPLCGTSNVACGFPAPRFPVRFVPRFMGPIMPERLSASAGERGSR